jgi:hypothetical protein
MVNPIQITQPQAYSGGADFSPLAKLYDVYKASQDRARQEAALGQLGDDPIANARFLTTSGSLPTAQLGLGMQDKEIVRRREDIANQQAQQNFMMQQKLHEAKEARAKVNQDITLPILQREEKRAQAKFDLDTPEGRKASIIAAGMDPEDPNVRAHIGAGAALPTPLALEKEKREAFRFEQEKKELTREGRLQLVTEGELDRKEPDIARWIAFGGDKPATVQAKLGLGTPIYTQDKDTGEVKLHQLRADKPFEPPPNHVVLGPGEIAAARAKGTATGKATGAAIVALPKLVDSATHQAQLLDEISAHPGRMWATGAFAGAPDWALRGTPGAGFRSRFGQINASSFLSIYEQMRGAGQITNVEGDKGTSAVNRMSAATNEKEFDDAVKDLKGILKTGLERAQRAAKGDFSLHPKELQEMQQKLGVGTPAPTATPAGTKPSLNDLIPLK